MWPAKSSRKFNRLGFLEHLEELRQHLLIILAATGIFSVAAYFFSAQLINFLTAPLVRFNEAELYFQAPYEAFLVHLKVSLLAGVLAASPVFFAQLWFFVAPGLHRGERRLIFALIFASAFLFLIGAAFAFWAIVPLGLRVLLGFQTDFMKPLLGVSPYFSFLVGMIFACGITFDLPLVVLGLVWTKVLTAEMLGRSRKVVIVLILVLTAVLTPSPDPVGQILLAAPLVILYEGCVWIAKWLERKK